MNKDRQHIDHDIETHNGISYEHNKRLPEAALYFRM